MVFDFNKGKSLSCDKKGRNKVFYLHHNRIASCCRAKSDILQPTDTLEQYLAKWQQESQQLQSGHQLSGCEHCWQNEKQGKISYRTNGSDQSPVIELYLSNLCNHMCSYCSPKFSSTWQTSLAQHGMFTNISTASADNLQIGTPNTNIDHWTQQISEHIQTLPDNSVIIKLLGGEPLMQKRHLQTLLNLNSVKIKTLSLQTNLNPPANRFLKWLLKNIGPDKLRFTVSIDASPEWNHWPRAKFNRQKFLQNLDLVSRSGNMDSFSAVISVLGIFDLPNFMSWSDTVGIPIFFNKLYNPKCLETALVPQHFRQRILESINCEKIPAVIDEILKEPHDENHIRLFEQFQYLQQYFQRNNLNPEGCGNILFEEYWTWLTKNYKKNIIQHEVSHSV